MSGLCLTPEQKIRQRHNWFLEADRLGNVRLACRLGISRKTFYKGKKRFLEAKGERSALRDHPIIRGAMSKRARSAASLHSGKRPTWDPHDSGSSC